MRLKLSILATAAILLPGAAIAQDAKPNAAPPAAKPATPPQATAPGQTGTTPGQEQATPGQASDLTPAVTGTTPSGQTTAKGAENGDVNANATAAANAKAEAAQTKVTKADVKAGATLFDSSGASVGKIDSVTAKGAVVDTGKVKVTIPLSSLAKGDKGLMIGMTKAEIEAAAKKSS
jgi:hypothetical protein